MATVFLGNTIFRGALNALRPCMDNLIFEGDVVVGGLYLNKLKAKFKPPKESYIIGNYHSGSIQLIDKNYTAISPVVDLKSELNKNGMFFYSPKVGVRDVCIDFDGYYWVLDWVYLNIYRFDKNMSYTGNYINLESPIDITNRETAPEGCYVKNNGNIVVVGRTLEAIIEFSFTPSESWQVDIGTFVSKTSYPAELADTTMKAIYQDRVTGEWIFVDNKYFEAHKLTPDYNFISTHLMRFYEDGVSYDNYYGITKTPDGNWLTTEINRDRFVLFDNDFNVISNSPNSYDGNVSGIALTYNISIDDVNPYDDAKLINSNCLRFNGIDNDIIFPHISALDDARNTFHFIYEGELQFNTFPVVLFGQRKDSDTGLFISLNTTTQMRISLNVSSSDKINIFLNINSENEIIRKIDIKYDGLKRHNSFIVEINNIAYQSSTITGLIGYDMTNTGNFTINSLQLLETSQTTSFYLKSITQRIYLSVNNIPIFDFSCTEGNNNIAYNRVDGSENQINGTITDIWSEKQDFVHNNIENGFDLWKNNTTDELLRVPYNVDKQSIKGENDTIPGYTWQSTHPANPKFHNYAETHIDFTNHGANTDIPIELNEWHPDNLSGLEGSQLFYNIYANKNTKKHLVYSQPITGTCLEKTKNYTKWK